MKVLVTGSHGFVGRRFVHRLSHAGHKVICVDDMSAGMMLELWPFQPVEKNCEFHYQNVVDFFQGYRCSEFDLVIHCAATVGGRRLIDGEPLQVSLNMSIDSWLFYWATHERNHFGLWSEPRRMPKVIYFSSSAIYPTELQTREKNVLLSEELVSLSSSRVAMPEASYGFSKLCGEYLARSAADRHGLSVAVYRPFGGYGEDQSRDYPFPAIIHRILDDQDPVFVWGSGEQLRDFIYIEDVISAVLQTYEKLGSADPLNLGTGIGHSFFEVAKLALYTLGIFAEVTNDPTKPEGVFARVADVHKLSQLYNPSMTPLATGVEIVAKHLKKQLTKKVTAL